MTAPVSEMLIRIAADTAQLRNDMNQMRSQMGGTFDDITKSAGSLKNALAGLFVGLGVGAAAKEFVETADAMSLMDARLKMTTGSSENFSTAQKEIYRIAQSNNAGLQETTALFTKMNEPVKRLGGGVKETSAIVESFSASMRLGGVSAQEASAATLQFAQAMGSGKLQGDEFRSLAEASPRFMKALADGMGTPIEKLKDMGSEGKLTADVVGNALMKSLSSLREEAAKMPDTVGGSFQRLKNDVMVAINELNQNSGLTLGIAGLISGVSDLIPAIKDELGGAFEAVGAWIGRNKDGISALWGSVKGLIGDVWDMAKGFGNVLGFLVEIGVKSGAFKIAVESIRIIVAGIEDGMSILGGTFSLIGAQILKVIGYFSDGAAEAAKKAEEAGLAVYERFAKGDTALGRLNAEMAKTNEQAKAAGESAKAAGAGIATVGTSAESSTSGLKTLKNAHAELTKEQKSALEHYEKLIESIRDKTSVDAAESQQTAKLTDSQKLALKVMEDIRTNTIKLTAEQKKKVAAALEEMLAAEKINDAHAAELKILKEVKAEREKETEALNKHAETLEQAAQKQKDENLVMSGTVKSLDALELGRLKEQRAAAQQIVTREELLGYCNKETDAHRRTLDALNDLIKAREEGAALKAAKDAAEEWQKTADTINASLTDALMRGFESGKSFAVNLRDNLVNTFKTMVLQPTIKAILAPVSGALGSLFGGSAHASGLGSLLGSDGNGGLSALLSGASSASSIWDMMSGGFDQLGATITSKIGAIGDWFSGSGMEGVGNFLNGNALAIGNVGSYMGGIGAGMGVGNLISGKYSAIGGNASWATGIGSGLGAIFGGPLGAAIGGSIGGLVNRAFGRGPKEYGDSGIEGTIGYGNFSGQSYAKWHQDGGWFRSDKNGTDTSPVASELETLLDTSSRALLDSVKGLAVGIGLESKNVENAQVDFRLKLSGNADEDKKAIEGVLTQYRDALASQYADALTPFQKTGEALYDTLQRLASVQISQTMLNQFGGIFSTIATAGVDATEAMVSLAGGLDALIGKAQNFVKDFYSDGEQAGLSARSILEQLKAVGLDAGGITGKTDFRALAESMDVNTSTGREQLNALLTLGPQFADISQYMADNQLTLQQLADSAPLVAALQPMFAAQTDATTQSTTAIDATTQAVAGVAAAVQAGTDATVSAINNLAGAITSAVSSAAASSASVAAAVSQKLDAIATERSLAASQPYEYR